MPDPLLYCEAMGLAAAISAIVVLAMLLLRRSVNKTSVALHGFMKYAAHRVEIHKPYGFVAPGTVGVGVVGLFGLLFIGRFFGEISTGPAVTMLLAPLLCWTTELPLLRNRKPWLVASFGISLVAILLIVVVIVARQRFDREMSPLLGHADAATFVTTTDNLSWLDDFSQRESHLGGT